MQLILRRWDLRLETWDGETDTGMALIHSFSDTFIFQGTICWFVDWLRIASLFYNLSYSGSGIVSGKAFDFNASFWVLQVELTWTDYDDDVSIELEKNYNITEL